MIMCMPSTPSPPKIVMPPPPPPPAMRDEPELAQAELDMAPESDTQKKGSSRKYRKVVKGKGKSTASSKYKGGGLNVV